MNNRNLIVVGLAILIGLVAVYLGNAYFSGVENRQQQIAAQNKLVRIVVAGQDLGFGTPISPQNVRFANWPENSVPAGAFTSIEEASRNRVALRPIVVGEPVLTSKVSGTNGRATIAANLPVGMLAYTVQINDVAGVGGFVRPGDVVDVLLTRQIPGDGARAYDKMTDIVLQAVPVLGVDQTADQNKTDPAVGKTATLQVSALDAQKLALASQLGVLSLALRNVTDKLLGPNATVLPRDLSSSRYFIAARANGGGMPAPASVAGPVIRAIVGAGARVGMAVPPPRPPGPSMTIIRGIKPTEYEVRRGY